jgi:hypothetical protein
VKHQSFDGAIVLLILAAATPLHGQMLRWGVSAGMGVTYRSPMDVVNLVNATQGAQERVPQFQAGVEFFAAASFPLADSWVLKIDYGYQITSLNIVSVYETAQFTVTQHCPTLILQYVLTNQGMFNVKAGAGVGYHFGRLEEKFLYIDNSFTAHGPALVAELEGNTAFGERLYAYLGVNAGWSLVGQLRDAAGRSPGIGFSGQPVTLNSFGVGARLGFTCYLN